MTGADATAVLADVDAAKPFVDDLPPLSNADLRNYGRGQLDVHVTRIRAAAAYERLEVLQSSAKDLGRLIPLDALVESLAKEILLNAAIEIGLVGELGAKSVKATIAEGIKSGKKLPLVLADVRVATSPSQNTATPIVSPSAANGGGDEKPPNDSAFDIDDLNRSFAFVIWGGKAVVVNEQPHGPVNDRVRLLSFDSMNQWYANKFTEVRAADGKVRPVTWATAWLRHRRRRQYDGVEFFPNPDGMACTPNYLNLWRGFSVTPSADGSCEKFKDHLRVNVCQEDEKLFRYLIGWLAHLVQRPRARAGIALVLRGGKGTGKTKVGEVVGSLFAPHYFLVDDARYLTGQFNSHMASCLLLQADEAMWAGDKAAEGRLKGLITSEIQMVEAKGIDPIRMENFVHVIMTSNESWVVPATGDERRFFVLDVGSLCQRNNTYFAEIDDELDRGGRERLLFELLSFDLEQFNIWDVPQTDALLDQKIGSLGPIDEFWHSRIHDGVLIHGDEDWRTVVARDDLYSEYLREVKTRNLGRARGSADFGKRIKKLAPEIRDTRPAIEKEPGVFRRTRCYEMPSLQECRESFERHLGQPMNWPALSPESDQRLDNGEPHAGNIDI
ncbi:DUF5906 domain-containing protein [Bradyrhizobium septentrionale]|uniref:DUF5906 domain-containing protein n=1 Tax=Bradyrhizobium septentrionale TaxID=1404411 RepID=UPI001596BFBF|nr:DUF5906 domain-containing protein [Bradyrhizobium septentrionale]UGY27175.1 DUF5906 domain-containing protein [Bradyrhizobium septentrionale]